MNSPDQKDGVPEVSAQAEKTAIEKFLGSSIRLTQEVPNPSRSAKDFAQGQKVGFERAQDLMRQLLAEEAESANESEV